MNKQLPLPAVLLNSTFVPPEDSLSDSELLLSCEGLPDTSWFGDSETFDVPSPSELEQDFCHSKCISIFLGIDFRGLFRESETGVWEIWVCRVELHKAGVNNGLFWGTETSVVCPWRQSFPKASPSEMCPEYESELVKFELRRLREEFTCSCSEFSFANTPTLDQSWLSKFLVPVLLASKLYLSNEFKQQGDINFPSRGTTFVTGMSLVLVFKLPICGINTCSLPQSDLWSLWQYLPKGSLPLSRKRVVRIPTVPVPVLVLLICLSSFWLSFSTANDGVPERENLFLYWKIKNIN